MKGDPILAADVIRALESFAPPSLAMQGDVIGLQVGRTDRVVAKVMLALDASYPVLRAAAEHDIDFLFTHHAMFYRPAARIDTSTAAGRAIATALQHDITVYSAHTNLDVAEGGVNDVLAQLFGLQDVEILDRQQNESLRKLVVFVPVGHEDAVRNAMFAAGAGHIGAYSHCSFNTSGIGTFRPETGARPFIGSVGNVEHTHEVRVETVVPEPRVAQVVREMLQAHPYDEVAYDLFPLDIMGKPFGIGRIGQLTAAVPLAELAAEVKQKLGLRGIRFAGAAHTSVRRVAVLGGAGARYASVARAKGADVLVTSDCDHHDMVVATATGLAVIDATHAALERPVLHAVRNVLHAAFGDQLSVQIADVNEDPFQFA